MSEQKLEHAHAIIEQAIKEYSPTHAFAMFSGGYDSLTTTHVSMTYLLERHPEILSQVAHINTGIGVEETREFVRETCKQYGWTLKEYHASETSRMQYRDLVLKFGFPGPAHHGIMYRWLKERSIVRLMKEHRIGGMYEDKRKRNRILLITGVRRQESVRRMGNVAPIQYESGRVWTAPLIDWSKDDILNYKDMYSLPTNEVVATLEMSGECLCGSYAHPGEIHDICLFYPKTGEQIRTLEAEVKAVGHEYGWGERSSKRIKVKNKGVATLCATCDARYEGTLWNQEEEQVDGVELDKEIAKALVEEGVV